MIDCNEVVGKVKKEFTGLTSLEVNGITGLCRDDGKYVVSLEVLERKAIPDSMDIIGMYEVRMDDEGHLVSFERKKFRKRADVGNN